MITIAKVDECNGILNAGEKGCIDTIFDRLHEMAGDGKQLCELMENSLKPGGVWRPWCNAYMTAAEKAWFADAYTKVKAVRDMVECDANRK